MNKQESSYRWVVFGVVLLSYIIIVSQRTAPGLITDQLMSEFQLTAAVIGLISSFQFFAYAGLQIPAGLMTDRYGPNLFLIVGTFLAGLGSVLYSVSSHEYLLMIARLLVGVGDATIFVNLILIMTQWFKPQEFVKLLGIISLAASFGSLVATVPYSWWIAHANWRQPFFITGMVLVVLAFVLYIVLVTQPKKRFHEGSLVKANTEKPKESVWAILKRLVVTRQAWATFLCHFGIVGVYVGFIGSWGVPYGIHVFDLTRAQASQLMMYGLIGAIIGGLFLSWITSHIQSIRKAYSFIQLTVFASWCGLFLAGVTPSYGLVIVFLVVIGFGMGVCSLTFAVVRDSFAADEIGVATGFANMGGFLSAVLLPIFFGNVLDLFPQELVNTGYHYGFIIPAVFSLMGVIGTLMIKGVKKVDL
nr:MFS transporter [Lysinibacillus timonensis]